VHRSKLKIHIEILSSLACIGPMKLTGLMTRVGLDRTSLEEHLDLLTNRGLVDSQNLGEDKTFYVLTERGMMVLKVMGSISNEASMFQSLQF
jgi:predicted transcriptional regulator